MVLRKCIVLIMGIILCWDVNALAQCGTTNIALNKAVTTSSNGAGTVAASLTDGVVSTNWQPIYSSDNYAQIDLGSSKTICRVFIKWGRYNAASSFKIQMSSTGAAGSWVDIASVTSNNPTVGNESGDYYTWYVYNDLNITGGSNTGRYIRIWAGTIASANWFVSDMEVYETVATNAPPSCAITYPASNITVPVNTVLTLTANATDPDGNITLVSFYNGASLIGNAPQSVSPYSLQWTPTATGTYILQAKATDNNGAIGSSLTVTVTVTPAATGWSLGGNATTGTTNPFLGTTDAQSLIVKTTNIERMRVNSDGKLLIGTTGFPTGAPATALVAVKGEIWAQKLRITQLNWPDFVFGKEYKLLPLSELATYIRKYKHLPGVPSVKEVIKQGISVGDNQAILLKKIEELTLYLLEQNRMIELLQKQHNEQQNEIDKLKKK